MNREEFCSIMYNAIDSLQEGVQIFANDGTYLYVNATAAAHERNKPEDLIGRKITEVFPKIENTKLYEVMQTCLSTKQPQHLLTQFTFPDESTGWYKLSYQPVEPGVMILSMDVTDMQNEILRRKEEELHASKFAQKED